MVTKKQKGKKLFVKNFINIYFLILFFKFLPKLDRNGNFRNKKKSNRRKLINKTIILQLHIFYQRSNIFI